MSNEKILAAIEKTTPKPPRVHELGGDYYYTCYWLTCGESLKKYFNYCPACGQRIFWEGGRV